MTAHKQAEPTYKTTRDQHTVPVGHKPSSSSTEPRQETAAGGAWVQKAVESIFLVVVVVVAIRSASSRQAKASS